MNHIESAEWKVPWRGMLFGLCAGTLALVLVFTHVVEPRAVLKVLRDYPMPYLLAALACLMGAWACDGIRMRFLTIGTGKPAPWWVMVLVLIASNFITLVTPFAAGGGPYVAYMLYRQGRTVPHAAALVAAGGLASQVGLTVLASLVLAGMGSFPPELAASVRYVRLGFAVYFLIVVALIILVYQGRRIQRLIIRRETAGEWMAEFQTYYRRLFHPWGKHFLRACLAGMGYFGLSYGAGFMILSGFGVSSGLKRYGLSVLLGVAPIISPIPGGAGAAELVAYHVLEKSLSPDALGTFIVLWRGVSFYIPVVVGGLLLAWQVMRMAGTGRRRSH